MRDILRKKISNHAVELRDTDYEVKILEERIHGLNEQLEALRVNRESKITRYESTVKETQDNIEDLMEKIGSKNDEVSDLRKTISDLDPQKDRLKQAEEVTRQLESARKKALEEVKFYEDHDNCPTCKQGLDEEHKKKHIEEKSAKATEVKEAVATLDKTIQETRGRLEEIRGVQDEIEQIQKEIGVTQTEVVSNQKYITKIQKEIELLKGEVGASSDTETKISDSEDKLEILEGKKKTLVEQGHYFDMIGLLLKDQGVKEKIIKQYIPIMNKLINKYLAQMEFYVGFEIDESFEETIKSRHRDEFKYDNFSQGEKMRIDLALLFTWRGIARMKNSVNTNLLVLDEVFDSSLDVNGTDEFLKLLTTLTEKTNAFIISHKGDALYDKFENVLRFEKHKNFSRIAE